MRIRALQTALAVALAAAPPRAAAVHWTGYGGLSWGQTDNWATNTPQVTRQFLNLNLAAGLGGFLLGPGGIGYGASAGWARASLTEFGAQSNRDTLDYRLQSSLFRNPASRIQGSLFAQQAQTELSGGGGPGYHSTDRSYGGDLWFGGTANRSLNVTYGRSESSVVIPGIRDAQSELQTVGANTVLVGPGVFSQANYFGSFKRGTYAGDSWDDHRVALSSSLILSRDATLNVSDNFTRRLPKSDSPFNPYQQLNSFSGSIGVTGGHSLSYGYAHGLQIAPDSPYYDRTSHTLGYVHRRNLRPDWDLSLGLDANASSNVVDDERSSGTGESLSLMSSYHRGLPNGSFLVRGSGSVGLVQSVGSTEGGWGAGAGGTWTRNADWTTTVDYNLNYTQDLRALGRSFAHAASGTIQRSVGTASVSLALSAGGERRDTPLGAAASRSFSLDARYWFRSWSLSASVGDNSGTANPVREPGIGDGLFLGLPYDVHTRRANLVASAPLTRSVNFAATADATWTSMPDRPLQRDVRTTAALSWGIGALSMSLSDEYRISTTGPSTWKYNQVIVTLSRSLGSRR